MRSCSAYVPSRFRITKRRTSCVIKRYSTIYLIFIMCIIDYQNNRYLNYGFIHDHYDLTQYGQLVWKVFDLEKQKELLLIVNENNHEVLSVKDN